MKFSHTRLKSKTSPEKWQNLNFENWWKTASSLNYAELLKHFKRLKELKNNKVKSKTSQRMFNPTWADGNRTGFIYSKCASLSDAVPHFFNIMVNGVHWYCARAPFTWCYHSHLGQTESGAAIHKALTTRAATNAYFNKWLIEQKFTFSINWWIG